jgi:glycosyltransferase involved in cell wall biosynthesis
VSESRTRPAKATAIVPRLLAARLLRAQNHMHAPLKAAVTSDARAGLAVVMAAHNEQSTLEECLVHLSGFADEIIVVDGESTDNTAAVAARFTDRVIATSNKAMLEINKNIAMDAATRRWILVVDPDERVSRTLQAQIREVVDRDDSSLAGYWMPRRNYILGRWVRTMGMYPGSQLRLVRQGAGRFSETDHHLPMAVEGQVGYLSGDLIHLSDSRVSDIIVKRTRYAEFAAEQMYQRGVPFSRSRLVSEPLRSFATQYLVLGGCLEGLPGLIYAALSAYGAFLRHARLWELHRSGRSR